MGKIGDMRQLCPPRPLESLMQNVPPEALEEVAAYFQVLAEPSRLQILNLLRGREHNVSELAQLTGFSVANVSRHLALMVQQGLVVRENRGVSVYVRIADPAVYQLCDLVCGSIARHSDRLADRRAMFGASSIPATVKQGESPRARSSAKSRATSARR